MQPTVAILLPKRADHHGDPVSVFILRRFAFLVVSLLASSVVIFIGMSVLGGDAVDALLGQRGTPAAAAELRKEYGLDRPEVEQYVSWMSGLVTGNLGTSVISGVDVDQQLKERLAVTIPLALFAIILSVAYAVPAGVYSAYVRRKRRGRFISVLAQIGIAVPEFWIGLLLVIVFAVKLGWVPAGGFTRWSQDPLQALRSLLLPAVAIAVVQGAILTRYVRASMIDEMGEEYVVVARTKGLSMWSALWRHGLRNTGVKVLTVLGLQLGVLISGAIIIENVFALPGLGRLVIQGVQERDLVLVQSAAMVLTALVLILNLVIDVLYGVIDPRIRVAGVRSD